MLNHMLLLIISILIGYIIIHNSKQELIVINEDEYWGPSGLPEKENTSIRPFKISITEEALKDLHYRLEIDRVYTPPLEGVQQQYGFNTNLLKQVVDYWKNKYDWREREIYLNQFVQYTTNIQGLNIHYIHVKPNVSSNISIFPLLLVHGWPGSVREFYRILPLLTQHNPKRSFVFEVIAPSLPGFGFSQPPSKPGMSSHKIAVIFKNLMKRVGFDKYYVQGGDWGAVIVSDMATLFPENILGLHSNMCVTSGLKVFLKILLGSLFPSLFVEEKYQHHLYPLSKSFARMMEESGYFHMISTKPDTLGVAVSQSPSGLAAHILEKYSTLTNFTYKNREDGGLTDKFTYNDLLDNIMIYWLTNSFTTSSRLYLERYNREQDIQTSRMPISKEVPCACVRFGQEVVYFTDSMLREKYTNLIHVNNYDVGGHFAAMEEPELLANDLFSAVDKMQMLTK